MSSRMDSSRFKWLVATAAAIALIGGYFAFFSGANDAAMLERGNRDQRLAAIQSLETKATAGAAETLAKYITDSDIEVARRVLIALGRMKTAAPIDLIKPALNDERPEIREAAVAAIGLRGLEGDPATLRQLLKSDPSVNVRLSAAGALGSMRDWDAMESFAEALNYPDETFQLVAAEQMLRIAGLYHQGFRPNASPQDRRSGINFLKTNWRYFKGTHEQYLRDKEIQRR